MPRPPLSFRLKAKDAKVLEALVHAGVQPVRVVVRALALLALDRGDSAPTVAEAVRLSPQAVRNIAQRYRTDGLDHALYERPYRPEEPEVCLDEKPVSLHAEVRPAHRARPGQIGRAHV